MSTNSFKIKNSAVLTPKDLSTLVSPEAGEIACDINDSNKIKRYDAASSSWVEVGSGGVGSVDIMFVQDFESASLSSFTQTGLSLSTTNPLHGKVSALLTHQAAINQSFKQIVAVDPKFRGQAMVLDLNVKSAASAGNVVIKVRDESNSSDLIVSEALQLSNDVSGRRSSVSFTIPSTCSSLSYTITALPEAGSPVTRIDDIVAMLSDVSLLETSVLVPNMTAWQGYTPTFQGFGTPSNVEFEWRQVGENVEIRGKFTSGTTTAVEARVGLPNGLTSAGTSLIPSLQIAGKAGQSGSSATYFGESILIEPSVTYVTFGRQSSVNSELTKSNADGISNVNGIVSFFASVPCAGLSATSTKTIPLTQSGLVQNADSMIRVSAANGYGSTLNNKIRRFSNLVESLGSDITYLDDPANGASFTINSAGIYQISYSDNSTAAERKGISKNSTQLTTEIGSITASDRLAQTQTGSTAASNVSWQGYLKVGDVIRPHTEGLSTVTNATVSFTISKQGSLKQVSVSSDQKITIPTSELRFEGASSRGSTDTVVVKFDTMTKLRGDAFTVESDSVLGTRITMKKAGLLNISTNLYANASRQVFISKNQAIKTTDPTASETLASEYATVGDGYSLSYAGFVNIGDVLRVTANAAPSSNTVNNLNLFFQEQDISVSVTNTLPQFSESDSSVRVDTANGYGSTATRIRRFSNVRDNIGTDIAYVDSATDGASFTVKSAGVYEISYTDRFNVAGAAGISKNASSLTTNLTSLSGSERLAYADSATVNYGVNVSWTGYLSVGDIIRPHTDGSTAGSGQTLCQFTISKVGKPNVTGVDVTPFVNVPQPDTASYSVINSPNGFGSTYTQTPRFLSIQQNDGKGILSYTDSPTLGAYWTANKKCIATISLNSIYLAAAVWSFRIFKNQTGVSTGTVLTTIDDQANTRAGATISVELNVGDKISFYYSSTGMNRTEEHVFITATALSDQILTAPETFSTDTASLSYKSSSEYTLSTLQNAPVGSYITFTYAANTNTRTQTTTRPTQTDADMNVNGMLIYTRAYNAASTAAQPAAFAIQIGKGLKGRTLDLYKSAGKVIAGGLDLYVSGTTNQAGLFYKDYNEVTGILTLDAAICQAATITVNVFSFSDVSSQTSGYLVINASKNPALTGLGLQTVAASYYTTAGASIANGVQTVINFGSQTFDTNGAVTTGAAWRFTSPETGYYEVSSAIAFSIPVSTRYQVQLTLRKNAVDYQSNYISATQNTTNNGVGVNGTYLVYLIKGDYIDMTITQDTGAARNMGTIAAQNFINIKKVSI